MAKKTKDNKKSLIVGLCVAAAVVLLIVVTVLLVMRNNPTIDDSYFVSDGSKYVLTLSETDVAMNDEEYNPVKTHLVYTYSGDEITGLKVYYEYADNDTAKLAADYIKQNYSEETKGEISVNGKYVVLTCTEEEYKDLTATDVKEQIELMELIEDMGDDVEEDGDVVEEDIEEDYEEDEDEE